MAPKRETQGPTLDTNPYGAFINLSVQSATISLAKPLKPVTPPQERVKSGAASVRKSVDPSVEGPPQTHLVVTYPGDWAPLSSTPVPYEEGAGLYQYGWEGRFRKDASLEAMHELINGCIRVAVQDARSNLPLAWADVDVLGFGLGASSIEVGTHDLVPNPAMPQNLYKATAGQLHGVKLWLTHRPLPPQCPDTSAQLQSPPPSSLSRSNTNSKSQLVAATPSSDLEQLPDPQPYSFLPPHMAKGCNIIELEVKGGVAPLPPTLPAAVAAATDSKAGSALQLSLGLQLPGGGPSIVLSNGVLTSATLDAPAPVTSAHAPPGTFAPSMLDFDPPKQRVLLTGADVRDLVHMLEDGGQLQCEVARYLISDSLSDPAWSAFRGVAEVPNSCSLLLPGTTETPQPPQGVCPLHAVPDSGFASALPHYVLPQGKGIKVLEEGLPANSPSSPTHCFWQEAGSVVHGLSVRFARPLVPAWKPPPSRPLMELVPPRPQLQPCHPAKQAAQAFKDQVRQMAAALVKLQLKGSDQSMDGMSTGADSEVTVLRAVTSQQQLKELLVQDGKLKELREALRRSSVAVAMEQHRRGIGGTQLTEQQQASLLVDLHSSLETAMAEALGASNTAQAPGRQQQQLVEEGQREEGRGGWFAELARLRQLAQECEVSGAPIRAEALYQRLVILATSATSSSGRHNLPSTAHQAPLGGNTQGPGIVNSTQGTVTNGVVQQPHHEAHESLGFEAQQALYAYATFCLRCGHNKHGRAEQLLRRILGLPTTQCSVIWPVAAPGGQPAMASDGVGEEGNQAAQLGGIGSQSDTKEGAGCSHGGKQAGSPAQPPDAAGAHTQGTSCACVLGGKAVHVPSLLALGVLMLHHGRVTDSMLLEEAAELARQLVAAVRGSKQEPVACALLHLVCQASGDGARAEDVAASLEGLQRAEAAGLVPLDPPASPSQPASPQHDTAQMAEHEAGVAQGSVSKEGSLSPPRLSKPGSPSGNEGSSSSRQASREASRQGRVKNSEGGQASEGGVSEASQPAVQESSPPSAVPMCLAPQAEPFCVNGLLALASRCATELALPAVALSALQQGSVELASSASLPEVSAEMDLAGVHAYRWIYCWEQAFAASSDSRFGAGKEDEDGCAGLGLEIEGSEWDRAQVAEFGAEKVGRFSSKKRASLGDGGRLGKGLTGEEAAAAALASTMVPLSEEGNHGDAPDHGLDTGSHGSLIHRNEGGNGAQNQAQGGNALQPEKSRPHQGEQEGHSAENGGRDMVEVARARAAEVLGCALGLCESAGRVLGSKDVRASLLAGELLFLGGHWEQAVPTLAAAMATLSSSASSTCLVTAWVEDATWLKGQHGRAGEAKTEGSVPLSLVLQLAASYEKLGRYEDALNLYLQACARRSPCATVWLLAGHAHAQLGQHSECEAALAEAVSLDAESPRVWAALALVALRGGPGQAASGGCAALACAFRLGLEDVNVLRELHDACSAAGLDAEARSCLEAAVAMAPKRGALAVATRLQLAQALVRTSEFECGRVCYEAALAISTSQRQHHSIQQHLLATRLLAQ